MNQFNAEGKKKGGGGVDMENVLFLKYLQCSLFFVA
jgi:hypothetical protein